MEESINQILSNIESLKNTNLIRKEDVILFVCELFYVVYLSKENHCESILNWSGNLLELVEKLIATIYNNTENSANGKLLSDIQEDLSKFKYVDLDCSKLINSLRNVDNKTIKELVKNGLFERLCSRYGMNGDFSSPNSVTLLAKELLNIDSSESILDMCSGVGNFLVEVASNCGVQILEGIDNNYQLSLISRIRLSIFTGRENIIDVGDALTYEYKNKYNKIFCNYPFGFKIDNYK